jgi:hypothetical protein
VSPLPPEPHGLIIARYTGCVSSSVNTTIDCCAQQGLVAQTINGTFGCPDISSGGHTFSNTSFMTCASTPGTTTMCSAPESGGLRVRKASGVILAFAFLSVLVMVVR